MAMFTTVRGVLSVAHDGARRGVAAMHGHTFEVWARFPYSLDRSTGDAIYLQHLLEDRLQEFDHRITTMEGEELAMLIGIRLESYHCDHVRLERRPEGIIAEWWA